MPHELNPCNWPDCEGPPSARDFLNEIAGLAEAAKIKGEIDEVQLLHLLDHTYRCKSPFLRDDQGVHVCDVKAPNAWERLQTIRNKIDPPSPKPAPTDWVTIAQDLESFPTCT